MSNIRYLVPPGKIRCFVTGKLRNDTPEEHVRQRWARSLVEEYGYPKTDIGIEVRINMGRARKFADIVVFENTAPHVQDNIYIILECKRDDRQPSDARHGEGQLKSYMAATPCRFGMWVGRERLAFEKVGTDLKPISDIPKFGSSQPGVPARESLVPASDLKGIFQRCHNYIYTNSGFQSAEAFYELQKLIFCKTLDEESSDGPLGFTIGPRERTSTSAQRRLMEERLIPLFNRVRNQYPFIFDEHDTIKLDPRTTAYVVAEIQNYSLNDTRTDVKGAAYEELVGANLRGDRGQYFTPRNVCDMAVKMIMTIHKHRNLTELKVLDCCCGTGGFLISWLNNLHDHLLFRERTRSPDEDHARMKARELLRKACERNLFGMDIDPNLVRTCQMNMVLHGDGSSNVYRADTVLRPGEWGDEARLNVPYGKIDVVLTNPPVRWKIANRRSARAFAV